MSAQGQPKMLTVKSLFWVKALSNPMRIQGEKRKRENMPS